LADIFTKELTKCTFENIRELLMGRQSSWHLKGSVDIFIYMHTESNRGVLREFSMSTQ